MFSFPFQGRHIVFPIVACPSVRPAVKNRPNNSESVEDIYIKFGTNVKHLQTMCREKEWLLHLHLFLQNYAPLKLFVRILSPF